MARFKVVIWYPSIQGDAGWGAVSLEEKISTLETAAAVAKVEIARVAGSQGIFVCPEYTLSSGYEVVADVGSFQIPIPPSRMGFVVPKLLKISRSLGGAIFIPGSMMVVSADDEVENKAVAYYNADARFTAGKKDDVGEANTTKYAFSSGNGGASSTIAGVTYGLQICRDASRAGYLKTKVDVHIVVSAGLSLDNIVDPTDGPPRLRILAERGGARADRGGGGVEFNARHNIVRTVAVGADLADPSLPLAYRAMKVWDVQYTDTP